MKRTADDVWNSMLNTLVHHDAQWLEPNAFDVYLGEPDDDEPNDLGYYEL